MKETNWYGIDVCTNCKDRLYDKDKMYSGGVCPKCGFVTAGTVCRTEKIVLKQFKEIPNKWRFWDIKRTYKGKDKRSYEWLVWNKSKIAI